MLIFDRYILLILYWLRAYVIADILRLDYNVCS